MRTEVQRVSKVEGAVRLLSEAIHLFFERRDPLAVHSLAAASHQVLADICIAQGRLSIIKSNPYLRPERRAEWLSIVNTSANFLKHADRDPDHILEFRPGVTPMFIIDAVQMHEQIEGRRPFEFNLFLLWFNMKFPDLLLSEPIKKLIDDGVAAGVDPDDYETILTLLRMPRDGAA